MKNQTDSIKKTPKKAPLNRVFGVSFTEKTALELSKIAKTEGLKPTELVRKIVLSHIEAENALANRIENSKKQYITLEKVLHN